MVRAPVAASDGRGAPFFTQKGNEFGRVPHALCPPPPFRAPELGITTPRASTCSSPPRVCVTRGVSAASDAVVVASTPLVHGSASSRVGAVAIKFLAASAPPAGSYELLLLSAARCAGEHVAARRAARDRSAQADTLQRALNVVADIYPACVAARLTTGRTSVDRLRAHGRPSHASSFSRTPHDGGAAAGAAASEPRRLRASLAAAPSRYSGGSGVGDFAGGGPARCRFSTSEAVVPAGGAAANLEAHRRASAGAAAPPTLPKPTSLTKASPPQPPPTTMARAALRPRRPLLPLFRRRRPRPAVQTCRCPGPSRGEAISR